MIFGFASKQIDFVEFGKMSLRICLRPFSLRFIIDIMRSPYHATDHRTSLVREGGEGVPAVGFCQPEEVENTTTCLAGLTMLPERKNAPSINRSFVDYKNRASMNSFITYSTWKETSRHDSSNNSVPHSSAALSRQSEGTSQGRDSKRLQE